MPCLGGAITNMDILEEFLCLGPIFPVAKLIYHTLKHVYVRNPSKEGSMNTHLDDIFIENVV